MIHCIRTMARRSIAAEPNYDTTSKLIKLQTNRTRWSWAILESGFGLFENVRQWSPAQYEQCCLFIHFWPAWAARFLPLSFPRLRQATMAFVRESRRLISANMSLLGRGSVSQTFVDLFPFLFLPAHLCLFFVASRSLKQVFHCPSGRGKRLEITMQMAYSFPLLLFLCLGY